MLLKYIKYNRYIKNTVFLFEYFPTRIKYHSMLNMCSK